MEKLSNQNIKNFYDSKIKSSKYQDNYEFNRWFSTPRLRLDYFMMHNSIQHHLKDVKFSFCLEIGPGPGTWTRALYRRNSKAVFDLVDISEEMKKQFLLEMRNQPNINYAIQDFHKYNLSRKYDLFFSSRAIEYSEDKKMFIEKVFNSLNKGGKGIIITKNPDFRAWRAEKDKRWQHKKKIYLESIKKLLESQGFKNIIAYPVIIRFPIIDRFSLVFSEMIYDRVCERPTAKSIYYFTESYLIKFEK